MFDGLALVSKGKSVPASTLPSWSKAAGLLVGQETLPANMVAVEGCNVTGAGQADTVKVSEVEVYRIALGLGHGVEAERPHNGNNAKISTSSPDTERAMRLKDILMSMCSQILRRPDAEVV